MHRLEEGSGSVGRPGQDTVRQQQQQQLRPHREQRIGGVGGPTTTAAAAANPPARRGGLSTAGLQASSKLGHTDRLPFGFLPCTVVTNHLLGL